MMCSLEDLFTPAFNRCDARAINAGSHGFKPTYIADGWTLSSRAIATSAAFAWSSNQPVTIAFFLPAYPSHNSDFGKPGSMQVSSNTDPGRCRNPNVLRIWSFRSRLL